MTPEQMLAGPQEEVTGLAETVQRLSSENETLRTQSTAGAVRTVTMANDFARLNKPTAFSDAEDEYSDWDFALTCFVGTMDPEGEANLDRRSGKRDSTHAQQHLGTVDDKRTKKYGTRCTRPKWVRSVQKSRAMMREHRTRTEKTRNEFQFRRPSTSWRRTSKSLTC